MDGLARPDWLRRNLYSDPRFAEQDRARVAKVKATDAYKAKQKAYDRKRNQTAKRRAADAARKRQRRAVGVGLVASR